MEKRGDLENPKSWPRFILRVDCHMSTFLTTGKRTRLAILSSSLKVWILLKVSSAHSSSLNMILFGHKFALMRLCLIISFSDTIEAQMTFVGC